MFEIITIALMISLGVLSIAGFYGGFHFGCYRMLQKGKKIDELILRKGDIEMLTAWNEYLIAISVKNNKPSYLEWMRWGFKNENQR